MNNIEPDSEVYRTLLESTRAIPWKIDWGSARFTYIGPQIEHLLGWSPSSWVSVDDWAARMHPDDRERVVGFCVSQSQAGVDHEADYRALTASGEYVWIRDVVHVVRDGNGRVEALVGFMFDITERKKTEEKLLSLQKELEVLFVPRRTDRRGKPSHVRLCFRQGVERSAARRPATLLDHVRRRFLQTLQRPLRPRRG